MFEQEIEDAEEGVDKAIDAMKAAVSSALHCTARAHCSKDAARAWRARKTCMKGCTKGREELR